MSLDDRLIGLPATFIIYGSYAYGITLLFGVPGYYLLKRKGWLQLQAFAIGGMILGLLPPLLFHIVWLELLDKFELYAYCAISGSLSATCCWLLAFGKFTRNIQREA
jgi:hypothetical protein